jgi:hypothetical protein
VHGGQRRKARPDAVEDRKPPRFLDSFWNSGRNDGTVNTTELGFHVRMENPNMEARLVKLRDGLVEVVYPVEAAGTVYGRAGGYWVQIDDPEVSRKHFKIGSSAKRGKVIWPF